MRINRLFYRFGLLKPGVGTRVDIEARIGNTSRYIPLFLPFNINR